MSTSYLLTSTQEATATDIREVLTDLDSVRILGDFGRDGTGGLDNVVLGGN